MAQVVFLSAQRRFTGGLERLEIPARDFRELAQAIVRRFPEFPVAELERCTVAIDGELVRQPLLEPLAEDTEIVFVPRVGAG
jgi:molybdopterin converting factor small subunit